MRTGSRAALALALCCTAAALTGCGPGRDGYAAVGAAAAGPERGAGENVPPRGRVEFQPLAPDGSAASASAPSSTSPGAPGSPSPGGSAQGGGTAAAPGGSAPAPGTPPDPGTPAAPGGTGGAGGTGSTAPGSQSPPGTPVPPATPTPPTPPGTPGTPVPPAPPAPKPDTTPPAPPATPARLTLSAPARAAASDRWCERVTVTFTNTGTTAARSGTVSFATHVIGALGIDWATITTTQPLPAPLAGGTSKTQTYTVCVESWRVPLGMHVETRRVTAAWS
ncbi:hypothetical protein [Streptomyces sp. NPDC031705]|uniref:hypothetical protein n=1 Tax=Streptomyces sp. NPDC031705 TaxID=3155729 RepID=UPI0033E9E487